MMKTGIKRTTDRFWLLVNGTTNGCNQVTKFVDLGIERAMPGDDIFGTNLNRNARLQRAKFANN